MPGVPSRVELAFRLPSIPAEWFGQLGVARAGRWALLCQGQPTRHTLRPGMLQRQQLEPCLSQRGLKETLVLNSKERLAVSIPAQRVLKVSGEAELQPGLTANTGQLRCTLIPGGKWGSNVKPCWRVHQAPCCADTCLDHRLQQLW